MISYFDKFSIYHTSRHVNNGADILANQTSGYMIRKGQIHIKRPVFVDAKVCSLDRPVQPVQETGLTIFSAVLANLGHLCCHCGIFIYKTDCNILH